MHIILAGGGDPADVKAIDQYFARAIDLSKPVLYIPVAMEASAFSYEECLEWFRSTYSCYGISHIEMCTDFKGFILDDRFSAVFIGGGNTFKLLKEMKDAAFLPKLICYLENGGTLYGGSAGAIICGKTIRTALHADENSVKLSDLNGLDLFDGYDIWCHYTQADDPLVESYDGKLYVLSESSGIALKKNEHYTALNILSN